MAATLLDPSLPPSMLKWLLVGIALAWLASFLRARLARRTAARRMLDHGKLLYTGKHEYAEAELARFPHLDAAFYAAATDALAAEGFTHLADLENLTVTAAGGVMLPAMARCMVGDGGTIMAGIYHARARGAQLEQGPNSYHVTEFETATSDGRFLTTSNAELAGRLESPPEILAEFHADRTMPFMLLDRHRARIRDFLAGNPGVAAIPVTTLAEGLAHQERMAEIKAAFRQGRKGVFSEAELRRIAPDVAPELTADVARRMEQLDG